MQLHRRRPFYGWIVVGVAFSITLSQLAFHGAVIGVFTRPVTAEFGWSRTAFSAAFSIGTFAAAGVSLLVGPILDRKGARMVLMVSGLVMGLSLVGVSAMQELWQFWLAFSVGRAIALGGSTLACAVAVANWFVRRRGRATALAMAGNKAGGTFLPAVTQLLISLYSWRLAFLALGMLTAAVVTTLSALFMKRRPEDMGLRPDGDAAPGANPGTEQASRQRQKEEVSWGLGEAVHTRALWLLMFASAFVAASQGSVNLHMMANFQDKGLSDVVAVSVVSFFAAVSAVAGLGWGFLVERVHVRVVALMVLAFSVSSMVVAMVAGSLPLALLFAVLYGLGLGGWVTVGAVIWADYFGRRSLGTIRGFVAPVQLTANAIGPLLAGLIFDITGGYTPAFIMFAVLFSLAFVQVALAVPPKRRVSPVPVAAEDDA
ncbi:MAG: MFS transporter [Chloroflexi bacterium]|nr:MFS transporter [Chloroflexota bacterium]